MEDVPQNNSKSRMVYKSNNPIYSGDYQPVANSDLFITAEDQVVKIWNINRIDAISEQEGAINNTHITFSQSEPN